METKVKLIKKHQIFDILINKINKKHTRYQLYWNIHIRVFAFVWQIFVKRKRGRKSIKE